jgi:hypothetical protein
MLFSGYAKGGPFKRFHDIFPIRTPTPSLQSPYFVMISGEVHMGPVSNIGNYNSGMIADTVNVGMLVHSNKSEWARRANLTRSK